MKIEILVSEKICKRCKQTLSLDNFWKNSSIKDGYFSKCKVCAIKISDDNYLKKQKYLYKNIWTCSTCNTQYKLNDNNFYKRKDSVTGFQHRCKTCLKKDPSRYDRLINKNDLKYYLKDNYHRAKYRAKKKGIEFNLTLKGLLELYVEQAGECAITGLKMKHTILEGKLKTNLSIDKINPILGYTFSNIQLVCNIVNVMKSNMTIKELKYFCNLIIKDHD